MTKKKNSNFFYINCPTLTHIKSFTGICLCNRSQVAIALLLVFLAAVVVFLFSSHLLLCFIHSSRLDLSVVFSTFAVLWLMGLFMLLLLLFSFVVTGYPVPITFIHVAVVVVVIACSLSVGC